MRLACLQIEPAFGAIDANLARIEQTLLARRADLVVLPELVTTGYLFADRAEVAALAEEVPAGPTTSRLVELARRTDRTICAGLAERHGDRLFNSAVLVGAEGYVGTYRKVHLFDRENALFDRGDTGFEVFEVGGVRIGMMICFDWFFPEVTRSHRTEPDHGLHRGGVGPRGRRGRRVDRRRDRPASGTRARAAGSPRSASPPPPRDVRVGAGVVTPRLLGRAAIGLVGLAGLAGCALVEEPQTAGDAFPSRLSRRDVGPYLELPGIAISEGSRRWLLAPKAILELTDGFLNFEFTEEEGLVGSILTASQDSDRIWIGTTRGIQSLDKELHFIRTYVEEPGLSALFVAPYAPGLAIAFASRGAVFIDALGLGVEIIPAPEIDIREATDVELFGDDLWVSTHRGLHRFSVPWKSWNDTFGGKEIKATSILRLERVADFIGDTLIGETLYAVTDAGVYVYRPTFDTWERLGL
jgi:hypothetical protein